MSEIRAFADNDSMLFCRTGHKWRVVSYDVASKQITERCRVCSFQQIRAATFSTAASRARDARHRDKVGRDAAKRYAGKMGQRSKGQRSKR